MNVKQYSLAKKRAVRPLTKLIRALVFTFGVPIGEPAIAEFSNRLYRPTLQARERNYRVGLKYLETVDLPSGLAVPTIRDYPLKAVTNVVREVSTTLKVADEPVTRENRRASVMVREAFKAIEGPISRHALDPARETIEAIGSDEDHESVGWARVLVGAYSCSFCAMLASRGPVYTSYETAKGRGGNPLNAYHVPYLNKNGKLVGGVCDCEAVLVKDFKWEGRKAWELLEDLWLDTGAKASGKDARLRFRREWDKQVRAGETGKYLVESLQPKEK